MKRWIVFIIISVSGMLPAMACGPYYPFGEDTRFSILNPFAFGYRDFSGFNYTASIFYPDEAVSSVEAAGAAANIMSWYDYCGQQADTAAINKAIYGATEITGHENSFINLLRSKNDTAAIAYIKFARSCNSFNTWMDDPWEKNERFMSNTRSAAMQTALLQANRLKNNFLRKRYAFLAMRMAYYNGSYDMVRTLYDRFYLHESRKSILDYWALFFRAEMDPDKVTRNYYFALVYAHAPDKRLAISQRYNREVSLASVLELARSNEERAQICVLHDLKNSGRGLPALNRLYQLNPRDPAFCFLLLREINKLEDWIYTPYYTYFQPSVVKAGEYEEVWSAKDASAVALHNVERDRQYAGEVLAFVQSIQESRVQNPLVVKVAKAYLQLMTGRYSGCLASLQRIPANFSGVWGIKALCLVARQQEGRAGLDAALRKILLADSAKLGNKLLYALGREFEYKGNTTLAALLYSKVNKELAANDFWDYVEGAPNYAYWRTRKNHYTLMVDFYDNYFFYLDAEYSAAQMKSLLADLREAEKQPQTGFEAWLYRDLLEEKDRLYDLLGTKYIRENRLEAALGAFGKVNDSLWKSTSYPYATFLNANPFYTNFYAEHQPTKADTVRYNKSGITAALLSHLRAAENRKNPNRDYEYFLAANCYFNMTQYGNSWMMRRYFWTSNLVPAQLPDDGEYFQANLAKHYYLKAMATARTPAFAALCLRMAGRCENYRLEYMDTREFYKNPGADRAPIPENRYYQELKTRFPDDAEPLLSNCYSFEKYMAARLAAP